MDSIHPSSLKTSPDTHHERNDGLIFLLTLSSSPFGLSVHLSLGDGVMYRRLIEFALFYYCSACLCLVLYRLFRWYIIFVLHKLPSNHFIIIQIYAIIRL